MSTTSEFESEYEKERTMAVLEAEQLQMSNDLRRREVRQWVQEIKLYMEAESAADKFVESALLIDDSKDYPRG
jgi:hypothetical protein